MWNFLKKNVLSIFVVHQIMVKNNSYFSATYPAKIRNDNEKVSPLECYNTAHIYEGGRTSLHLRSWVSNRRTKQ